MKDSADLEKQLAMQCAFDGRNSATLRCARRRPAPQNHSDTHAKLQADLHIQSARSWCVLAI